MATFDRPPALSDDAAMSRLAVLLVLVCACSKAKETEPPPAAPPAPAVADAAPTASDDAASVDAAEAVDDAGAAEGSDGGAAAASDFDFDKLSHDDQVKFMKQKVMPTMKPLFQKFDPKHFAKFTCKTCHGKDPAKAKYKMPSKDLPKLDFDAIKAGKEDPKAVEFMSKTVKPEMARLLNEPEMTESQPKGFGCLDCHTLEKK
jgi:hypothetical protein